MSIPSGIPTPDEALGQYLAAMKGRGLEKSTIDTAGHQLRPFVESLPALDRASKVHVLRRLARLTSIASKSNTLKEMNRFLIFCVKKGWTHRNPAAGITVEGRMPTGKPQLTRAEARVLIAHLLKDESEAATFTLLLLMTGARKSELLKRRVRDVDVAPNYDHEGREYGLVEVFKTKTTAGVRGLRVYEPALSRLRQQAAGKSFKDYLFPGEYPGQHHCESWPNDNLERQCEAAGVSVVPPHGLRGTAGSWAKEVGVIGAAISRDLGHNGQAVTNRHYVKADAGAAAQAAQIAASLAPAPPAAAPSPGPGDDLVN